MQDLASQLDREEAEEFLYAEAAMLDDQDYAGWFRLFADDGTYWIPSGDDDMDPTRRVSLVYDDITLLSERVRRFQSGIAYAQQPASRTVHTVSNVRIHGPEPDRDLGPGLVPVDAAFVVVEFRRGQQHFHAGRYRYTLVRGPGNGMRIQQKKVLLVNNAGHLGNLSLLL